MRFYELIRFALGAIVAHPMRSALTSLGVVIGVAAVVMMTAIGLGAQQRITGAISGLGSNLIIVMPNFQRGPVSQGAGAGQSLRDADAEAIARQVEDVAAVAPSVTSRAQLAADGANWNTRIEGVTPEYLIARDLVISSGRMFDEREARQGRKVLVLGATVARELWGDADPVGRRVRVRTVPFEVIGVLESKGQAGLGQDQDDVVLAPLQAVRSRLVGRRFRGDAIQTIYVKSSEADTLDRVQEDVINLLRDQHKIRQGEEDDFQTQNMASILATMQAAVATFTIFLAAVAAVSLVVGGVGIMNIMLVSVTERTREIGIRLAIGAHEKHILIQFLVEATVLSLLGGLIGIAIGLTLAGVASLALSIPFAPSLAVVLLAVGFSALIGMVFGFFPALRGARLDPIEALRHE